jgi:nanoRNase/pAp phosphatase (c-di-AMP/oligoRNAs hydrolase)
MLLGYFQAFGLYLNPQLATAAYYAIVSETQDLERDASKADREACLKLFPLVHLVNLGKIRHPRRGREYYRTIARAMQHVMVGKNTCICHMGLVPNAELVAEVSDFLVAMKQVTWCMVSGFIGDAMLVSLRTTHPDGRADQIIKKVLRKFGHGGGHEMMAGGSAACEDLEQYRMLATQGQRTIFSRAPAAHPRSPASAIRGRNRVG